MSLRICSLMGSKASYRDIYFPSKEKYWTLPKAATIKLIVSHDFAMVKPTLPPGKKKRWPRKKRTIILSKIKDFYYGSPINNVKHGFMTFSMVNICVRKKFPDFELCSESAKLTCMPKVPLLQKMCHKTCFLFLEIRRKPTGPAMRNNEFNSRGLTDMPTLLLIQDYSWTKKP